MKISTFNLENLFHRDEKLIKRRYGSHKTRWAKEMDELLRKRVRGMNDVVRMRELWEFIEFQNPDAHPYFVMRKKAGNLYLHHRKPIPKLRAAEPSNWNGWVRVKTRPIPDHVTRHKAQVITENNPDILLVQEVEDRQSLVEFNQEFLPEHVRFTEVMVLPGNNDKGQELGIMTKNGYKVNSVRSHVNDSGEQKWYFDKDFQEYEVITPQGKTVWILVAHLQDAGADKKGRAMRKEQARIIADSYHRLKEDGVQNIILAGTFNASSYCDSLAPLREHTDLRDVKVHPSFDFVLDEGTDADYYSLGAFRVGINTKQLDYLMLSPAIFRDLQKSGISRKGVWPEQEDQYQVLPNMRSEMDQASSHPLLWVEIDDVDL